MREATARKDSKRIRLLSWALMLSILLVIGARSLWGSTAANLSDSGATTFVVIVGGPTCDATRIDPATVRLGGRILTSKPGGVSRPILKDVDGDNRHDFLLPIHEERLLDNSSFTRMQLTGATYDGIGLDLTWFFLKVENSTGTVKEMVAGGSHKGAIAPDPCVDGPLIKSIGADTPTFGRLVRDGILNSCAVPKPCPGTEFPGVFAEFDAFRTNHSGLPICVTVTTTAISCASGVHTTAILGGLIDFTNLCNGYAGDPGQSTGTDGSTTFSFNVPAGEFYSLIFFEDTPAALCSSFSYTISLSPCFNGCLEDDNNGNILQFNSNNGDYLFTSCSTGFTLTGTGTLIVNGCTITLQHLSSDRRISASVNTCQQQGSATVLVHAPRKLTNFTIADTNTANNTCTCP